MLIQFPSTATISFSVNKSYIPLNQLAIKMMRVLDSDWMDTRKRELQNILNKYQQDYRTYQKSEDYRAHMPKRLDRQELYGYKYHDFTYSTDFFILQGGLSEALEAFDCPLKPPLSSSQEKSFGILIASRYVFSSYYRENEILAKQPIALGREVVVFTKNENINHLNEWFRSRGLETLVYPMEKTEDIKKEFEKQAPIIYNFLPFLAQQAL